MNDLVSQNQLGGSTSDISQPTGIGLQPKELINAGVVEVANQPIVQANPNQYASQHATQSADSVTLSSSGADSNSVQPIPDMLGADPNSVQPIPDMYIQPQVKDPIQESVPIPSVAENPTVTLEGYISPLDGNNMLTKPLESIQPEIFQQTNHQEESSAGLMAEHVSFQKTDNELGVTYHDPNIVQTEGREKSIKKHSNFGGLIKLFIICIIPLSAVVITINVIVENNKKSAYMREKEVLISVPMKNVNWQDLGNVFEPVIALPVKTLTSYENWEFLIDSGAVISSLPNEWAGKTGQDLAFLKRSTFRGFGGKTSFAYQGEMKLKINQEEIALPVVFTEATSTKSLLGRKGFFENYSIYFNHKDKQIEIRR